MFTFGATNVKVIRLSLHVLLLFIYEECFWLDFSYVVSTTLELRE